MRHLLLVMHNSAVTTEERSADEFLQTHTLDISDICMTTDNMQTGAHEDSETNLAEIKEECEKTCNIFPLENVKVEMEDDLCGDNLLEVKQEHEDLRYSEKEEEEVPENESESTPLHRALRESKSTSKTIQCNQCDESFDQKDIISHIVSIHPKQNMKFFCVDCGKGFNFETGLTLHRANYHGGYLRTREVSATLPKTSSDVPVLFSCGMCQKTFRHLSALSVHLQNHTLGKVYECKKCEQQFMDQESYEAHSKIHDETDPTKCHVCDMRFASPGSCREHVNNHKEDAKYKCKKTHETFTEAAQLDLHAIKHTLRSFECRVCHKELRSRAKRDRHELVHSKYDKPSRHPAREQTFANKDLPGNGVSLHRDDSGHTCNICGAEFSLLKNMQAHHREHAVEKVITCEICGETFNLSYSWKRHMKIHLKDGRRFRCVACPKRFTSGPDLEEHVAEHANDTCLDCWVCGKKLADPGDVLMHIKKHKDIHRTTDSQQTKGRMPSFKIRNRETCPVCEKTFHFVSSLQSHMRIHDTDQSKESLNCHLCRRTFVGIKGIREHIGSVHANDPDRRAAPDSKKRHRCDICLERFVSYFSVKTHRLLHTGVKPFKCDICGAGYVLMGSLKNHKMCHGTDRPHMCEICGKSFRQKYPLLEHQMLHAGMKPFICHLCGNGFVNKKKLHLHTFVHTRQTPFNCKVCGKGFRASVTRQKHRCGGSHASPSPPRSMDEYSIEGISAAGPNADGSRPLIPHSGAGPSLQKLVPIPNYAPDSQTAYAPVMGSSFIAFQQQAG